MRILTARRVALLGLLLLAAAAVACSSDKTDTQARDAAQEALATRAGGIQTATPTPTASATASGSSDAATPAAGGGDASTVNVSLKEWSVSASPDDESAGPITFDAKNDGVVPHELLVIKSDAGADKLPVANGTVDVSKVDVVAKSDQFNGGETATVDAGQLAPGTYVLICNVVGHYQLGMHTTFTVK